MKAYVVYVKGEDYENVEAFLTRVDAEDYATLEREDFGAKSIIEEYGVDDKDFVKP